MLLRAMSRPKTRDRATALHCNCLLSWNWITLRCHFICIIQGESVSLQLIRPSALYPGQDCRFWNINLQTGFPSHPNLPLCPQCGNLTSILSRRTAPHTHKVWPPHRHCLCDLTASRNYGQRVAITIATANDNSQRPRCYCRGAADCCPGRLSAPGRARRRLCAVRVWRHRSLPRPYPPTHGRPSHAESSAEIAPSAPCCCTPGYTYPSFHRTDTLPIHARMPASQAHLPFTRPPCVTFFALPYSSITQGDREVLLPEALDVLAADLSGGLAAITAGLATPSSSTQPPPVMGITPAVATAAASLSQAIVGRLTELASLATDPSPGALHVKVAPAGVGSVRLGPDPANTNAPAAVLRAHHTPATDGRSQSVSMSLAVSGNLRVYNCNCDYGLFGGDDLPIVLVDVAPGPTRSELPERDTLEMCFYSCAFPQFHPCRVYCS